MQVSMFISRRKGKKRQLSRIEKVVRRVGIEPTTYG
jgi:hypothetical protein